MMQPLRKELSAEQYAVTQKNATEPAFHNKYWNEHRPGIYVILLPENLCLSLPTSLIQVAGAKLFPTGFKKI